MEPRDEEQQLLHDNVRVPSDSSRLEKAMSNGGRGAAVLAKQLPTGTALLFQVLSPITTARGNCYSVTRIETVTLILICAISCILPNFTDSFRDSQGKLRYGIATFTGIFVFDRSPPPQDQNKYRIRASDFLHAFTSLIIFIAVVLYNKEIEKCLFSGITDRYAVEYLIFTIAPVFIGILGCILFCLYPSTRHGFGFPIGGVAALEE